MNLQKRIWILGNIAILLLVVVSTRLVYWQLWRGDELQPVELNPVAAAAKYAELGTQSPVSQDGKSAFSNLESLPQPVLQRTVDLLKNIQRGKIYDDKGNVLAEDRVGPDGKLTRFYTEPSLAQVIGYDSALRTGLTGLEFSYNETLLGVNRPDAQLGQIFHQPIVGSDLILTIDSDLQRLAERSLDGRPGAVVAMDAHSGAVLAMASSPRFDPNRVLEDGYAAGLNAACGGAPACQAPFLNRATQALYPPGSTWKTVALIAGLDTGQLNTSTVFDFGEPVNGPNGPYYVYHPSGGGTIIDPNHTESKLSLEMAYAKSANAAFGRIGDEMRPDVMVDYARRFGFSPADGKGFPLEIEASNSLLANNINDIYNNNMLRASTAIGQGELMATPLDMGMVVLAVMNDGKMPLPYFVDGVRDPYGNINRYLPNRKVYKNIMKPETARTVKQMMVTEVEKGSGTMAKVPGAVVGGKTGTAQVGGDANPHAWFIGFAENKDRAVVVVAVLENGGSGWNQAAPIFAKMAAAALK